VCEKQSPEEARNIDHCGEYSVAEVDIPSKKGRPNLSGFRNPKAQTGNQNVTTKLYSPF